LGVVRLDSRADPFASVAKVCEVFDVKALFFGCAEEAFDHAFGFRLVLEAGAVGDAQEFQFVGECLGRVLRSPIVPEGRAAG